MVESLDDDIQSEFIRDWIGQADRETTVRSGVSDIPIEVYHFGELDYLLTQRVMQSIALAELPRTGVPRTGVPRTGVPRTQQIWILQHPQVYTQGTACAQTPFVSSSIPVVQSDRGGQITFHGPGQIVMYPLLDLRAMGLSIKGLVNSLEQAVIDCLAEFELKAARRDGAPGVYINEAKIAALGLRVKRGMSYHGLSLNVDMDLTPFKKIDPCGYAGLQVTSLAETLSSRGLVELPDISVLEQRLVDRFVRLI